jgi:carboxypeptidase C (cathepsin A)
MLYIEQPAGVGYSYCDYSSWSPNNRTIPQDCHHSDDTIGRDNLYVILHWFEKYPEYKANDLYVSGESYGGIYVPYTTFAIHHHNEQAKKRGDFQPNLKGFMVGNGVTNWNYDTNPATIEMMYWHSMYNTTMYEEITALNCESAHN